METIQRYIESLFINMPNTPEVCKAKDHLLEMAEDKYLSLKEEGVSDNEAVAKVISEFGNLDELKEELGIEEVVKKESAAYAREIIPLSDVKEMIRDFSLSALLRGLSVFCFITCTVPTVIANDRFGGTLLFIMVAIAIVLLVIQSSLISRWKHLSLGKYAIAMDTAAFVKDDRRRQLVKTVTLKCVGILLIVTCFVPSMYLHSRYSGASVMVMTGSGIALLVYSLGINRIYTKLLSINPQHTVGGSYSSGSGRVVYDNPNLSAVMSVYWTLVVCLYLSISFLTFAWHITWVIFVMAVLIRKVIDEVKGRRE